MVQRKTGLVDQLQIEIEIEIEIETTPIPSHNIPL